MIRARLRSLRPDFLIILAYLILPLWLYASVTIGSRTMLPADKLFQWPPWRASAAELGLSTSGVVTPHNALISDLIIQNYAWKNFVLTSLSEGDLPLWNPYLFAGAPFLANGQHAALYPFGFIFLVVPLAKAYGWFALSQVWLAGVSMYLFGRILGMRRGGAALSGFVYQGAQFLVISAAVFPMIAAAVVWLPFLLGCIDRVVVTANGPAERRGRAILWLAAGAIALGCQVLAGHAEFTYYTLLIMALFAAWRILIEVRNSRDEIRVADRATKEPRAPNSTLVSRALHLALWLSAMVATGLLIGSLQLVPLVEVGRVNFRAGSASFEEVRGWAYPPRNALTFLLPNFFGNPTHHTIRDAFTGDVVPVGVNYHGEPNPYGPATTSWGTKNYVEGAAYMGILPLLLAGIGLTALGRRRAGTAARRAHALFFAGLAFFSLAFIFGTPLYAILYYGLPFIDQLHTPFRWVFPLALSVAVLAGFGADEWRAEGQEGRSVFRSLKPASLLPWLAIFAGGAVIVLTVLSRVFFDAARPLVERLFHALAGAEYAFPSAEAFYSYLFWQLLLFGGLLAVSGIVLRLARRTRLWIVLACGLIIFDLYAANAGFHAAADPALLEHTPAAVRWLNEQPGQWRITTYDTTGAGTLNANTPWLHDLADIRGYDSIIPRQFTDYMAAIEPQNGLQFNRIQPIGSPAALDSPLLDVLAVKYVISAESITSPKYRPVWEGEGVVIYENLAAAPRAYTLPRTAEVHVPDDLAALTGDYDPRRYVVIESDVATAAPAQPAELIPAAVDSATNNQVEVTASVDEPSWLILGDSYFNGWRVYVRPAGSGEESEIESEITRVNGNFRGVPLEPGDWTVRFRYSPRSFQLGGLMSFMGLSLLIFVLGVWAWGRFYRPDSTASTTRSVAKNSAAPMALNLFNKGIDFVFAAFYLRVLGPAAAGSFATAIATAGLFEIVANYGLNILLIRDVSQDRSQAGRFLLNSSVLRIFTAAVAALPVVVYLVTASRGSNPLSSAEIAAIILMMIGMVFSGLALGVSGLFYVYEEAEIPAAMSTVSTILKVGLGVAVLLAGFSFVGLAAVSIVVNVVTLLLLSILALRRFELHGPWTLDGPMIRDMLRLGFPLMLIHLLQTVFISIDVLLLRQLLPDGERVVGWYNSAWKWFNALQIIPSYFTLALFPIISRAIKENMDSARRMYRMSLKIMLLLALPIAALTTFAAPLLIRVLGGPEFLPQGAVALQIVIWSIPFGWLNSVTNYVLIALGLERMQPRAFVVAVGFNILFNYLFIPRFSFVAAGITTILSEVVLLVMFAHYLRQRGAGMDWLRLVARPVLLTAVMMAVMWAGNRLHLLVALALGVIVYLAGLTVLHIIEPQERQAMAAILPAGLTRRLGWSAK
ncbi:MAG: oligosaccharide flippase family protein [Candidatus Promineofilum sp.]|nr:oligosaccharide flippase family protein [Promineifilum sp.]MBP9657730.1 oligosaccharide flippase family protein [Promineifilum sp.]